jgi:hypothetical protein
MSLRSSAGVTFGDVSVIFNIRQESTVEVRVWPRLHSRV